VARLQLERGQLAAACAWSLGQADRHLRHVRAEMDAAVMGASRLQPQGKIHRVDPKFAS
jgi:hypothetical protein